jgi:hypothetical protein
MRLTKPAAAVIFAEDKAEKIFISLLENSWSKKALKKCIENLKQNAFCGEKIKRERIPKEYIQKYNINNLFWYQLPKAWRLVYSIIANQNEIIVMIIEYFNHKDYERRFGY